MALKMALAKDKPMVSPLVVLLIEAIPTGKVHNSLLAPKTI